MAKRRLDADENFEAMGKEGSNAPKRSMNESALECRQRVPVTVGIAEAPDAGVLAGQTITLHATHVQPSSGGTLAWQIVLGNALQITSGTAGANLVLTPLLATGTCIVTLTHTFNDGAGDQVATAVVNVHVVDVAINPSPTTIASQPANVGNVILTATGSPPGGVATWDIPAPSHVPAVTLPNAPVVSPQATLVTAGAPGTETVRVRYAHHNVTATATALVHAVGVVIQQPPGDLVNPPNTQPAAYRQLIAVGTPGGGAFVWTLPNTNVVRFRGNQPLNHGVNQDRVEIASVAAGNVNVSVQYTFGLVPATDVAPARVREVGCGRVDWAPAGGNVNPSPVGPCLHSLNQAERQRPHTPNGPLTVLPMYRHHHGEACHYCALSGRDCDHWIDPDIGQNGAAADVDTLIGEMATLRGLLAAWNANGGLGPMPALATVYIANHPWLANVPVWRYNPAAPVVNRAWGKMIGVLRGVDGAGTAYLLRAVSGDFVGHTAPVNAYWSPHVRYYDDTPTASRGLWTNAHAPQRSQYGRCAATALLSHALHLNLRVDSMAEAWFGQPAGRTERQLQTSCNFCRMYLPRMLCDNGPNARTAPTFIHGHNPPQNVPLGPNGRGF